MDKYEFTVFSISHFCCEARWRAGDQGCGPYIEVRVFLVGSSAPTPLDTCRFPTTSTLREIKRWTANYILQIIEEMERDVRVYRDKK